MDKMIHFFFIFDEIIGGEMGHYLYKRHMNEQVDPRKIRAYFFFISNQTTESLGSALS